MYCPMSVSYQVVQLETQNASSQINQLLDFVPMVVITMIFKNKLRSHVHTYIYTYICFYLNKTNHSQLTKIPTRLFSCPLRLIGPPE